MNLKDANEAADAVNGKVVSERGSSIAVATAGDTLVLQGSVRIVAGTVAHPLLPQVAAPVLSIVAPLSPHEEKQINLILGDPVAITNLMAALAEVMNTGYFASTYFEGGKNHPIRDEMDEMGVLPIGQDLGLQQHRFGEDPDKIKTN